MHNRLLGPFPLDSVQASDCIEGMRQLPDDCVDVAIADPPYNASKGGAWKWDGSSALPGFGGEWTKVAASWDDMPLGDYVAFTMAWVKELARVVRPTGSLWIHGTYHNIGIINLVLQMLGVEIVNEVVWYKRNSFPNLSGRRLTASHETLLWAHTGGRERRYHFDYALSREMDCAGDRLKAPGKQMRTVWDIPNNKQRSELAHGKHPTQKPLGLLKRMLRLSATEGQVLLVPFAGSGSDCVAARELGLRFLAFETDAEYVDLCSRRLGATGGPGHRARDVRSVPSLIKWTGSKRSQARAIAAQLPSYRRYFEPFVGSGAMLFAAACPGSVAGDLYGPLIDLWKLFQSDPHAVVEDYRRRWEALQIELDGIDPAGLKRGHGLPRTFYEIRDRFNETHDPLDLNFLQRTCVNGIVRFNDRGEFNNSFHLSRRGMLPDRFERVVVAWTPVMADVEFVCGDYAETLSMALEGDLVYLDPPYAGSRHRYIEDLDPDRFFGVLDDLNTRAVSWALSFDGRRGTTDLTRPVPPELYRRKLSLQSGNSAVKKVLDGRRERVEESLYLSF